MESNLSNSNYIMEVSSDWAFFPYSNALDSSCLGAERQSYFKEHRFFTYKCPLPSFFDILSGENLD